MSDSENMKFLKRVKAGEYAQIEESSLQYARMAERTIMVNGHKIKYRYGLC